MKKIMIIFLSSTMLFGCGKIEPQIAKLKGLITKNPPAASKENTVSEMVPNESINSVAAPVEQANVEACVDQRVDAFRKEYGEDRAINYDVLEEWESECKEKSSSPIFSCMTNNHKAIRVYVKNGLLHYEFGVPNNAPEMSLAIPPGKADISLWSGVGRYESYSIGFANGNTIYSVFWSHDKLSDKGGVEAGVNVERNGSILTTVNCGNQADIFYDTDKLIDQTNNLAGVAETTALEQSFYRMPRLIFEKNDLIEKMRNSGVEDFYLKDILAYLDTPKIYWNNCVSGYADESKQRGGYGEAEAQKYGEQVCKSKTNALYACLNEESIKSAASCLKKEMEEEMANAD